FFPIPIEYFKSLKRPVCDVFWKDPQSKKHVLKLAKNKDYDWPFLEKLVKAGVTELYVDKMNRLEFVHNVTAELMVTLEQEDLSEDEAISAADKGVELLSRKLLTIGVSEETINLAKQHIDIMRKNVKKSPQLSLLLARLISNESSYLFKHTQILTYVSLH